MEETRSWWEEGGGVREREREREREWKKKKKEGISHLVSQRREVGDTKRPRLEPEERTKQPVRAKVRGNRSCGTRGENGTTSAFVLWLRPQ